jgi:hypothetical protein
MGAMTYCAFSAPLLCCGKHLAIFCSRQKGGLFMAKAIEKVFIVWGGNKPLADLVSAELKERNFDGVVGGGTPTDMYIGTQIFSQIAQCTRAVILVQNVHHETDGAFSNNLMFEWGYLTAKMDPRKLHVFLIGDLSKTLPSDLAGIWASEIKENDKSTEQIAKEIVDIFFEAASRPIEVGKIEVLSRWTEIKRDLSLYTSTPTYSEIELAHYMLHSIESCYYYMEETEFLSLIDRITPISTVLEFAMQIVKSNAVLFGESLGLTKELSFDTFAELKSVFETKFDFSNQDINLHMWFKYFCADRLALLFITVTLNNDLDQEIKNHYLQKAIECDCEALQCLTEIVEKYPQETIYAKLYEGYVQRDLFKGYKSLGDEEEARQHILAATKAREAFYLHFKQRFPNEGYLTKHFGEEYYLCCAESLAYIQDPIERKITENKIRSFLEKIENESGRQHIVLKQLQSAFGSGNS